MLLINRFRFSFASSVICVDDKLARFSTLFLRSDAEFWSFESCSFM